MKKEEKKRSGNSLFLLRRLRMFGLDHLDAVVLAALADGRPLLLIGSHGTAKSEMLNRFACELELEHRHYNASLLSFDDLLGYPVLNPETRRLEFIETEASVWGAESIFLDEISRCRPETANKLFALVHERRVQGIELQKLRYRWAAMNPPVTEDDLGSEEMGYSGSFPLDPALADRFAWVVPIPSIAELSIKNRRTLVAKGGSYGYRSPNLPRLVEETRAAFGRIPDEEREWAVEWSAALSEAMRDATFRFSGRRHIFLRDSALWVYAASQVLNRPVELDVAAQEALIYGIPQRAQGISVDRSVIRAIHRKASEIAGTPCNSPLRKTLAAADPVRRIFLAMELEDKDADSVRRSEIVLDAFASLPQEERTMLSILLARHPRISSLGTTAVETVSSPFAEVMGFAAAGRRNVSKNRRHASFWNEVLETISGVERAGDPDYEVLGNTLMLLFATGKEPFDCARLVERFRGWREMYESGARQGEGGKEVAA